MCLTLILAFWHSCIKWPCAWQWHRSCMWPWYLHSNTPVYKELATLCRAVMLFSACIWPWYQDIYVPDGIPYCQVYAFAEWTVAIIDELYLWALVSQLDGCKREGGAWPPWPHWFYMPMSCHRIWYWRGEPHPQTPPYMPGEEGGWPPWLHWFYIMSMSCHRY